MEPSLHINDAPATAAGCLKAVDGFAELVLLLLGLVLLLWRARIPCDGQAWYVLRRGVTGVIVILEDKSGVSQCNILCSRVRMVSPSPSLNWRRTSPQTTGSEPPLTELQRALSLQ